MDDDSEYIKIGGRRLEIARYGPSPTEAPTLVFLHHGLGCVGTWQDFPFRLATATGCGAIVYSRLGHGRSDPCPLPPSTRFMHDEGLEVLPELLDIAGVRECVLIGHSDGGSIAIIYAGGTSAGPLRGVITEAAHVFFEPMTVRALHEAKESYERGELCERLRKHHGRNTDGAFRRWNDTWLHPDFVDWDLREYLPHVKVPMLVIQGEDDEYGTAAQTETIARHATAETRIMMLPGCGHSPHLELETMMLEAMSSFISRALA